MPDPDLEAAIGAIAGRYFGKYRGEVVDNADPTSRGRLLVKATSVMGDTELWAMPCVPYAGDQVGYGATKVFEFLPTKVFESGQNRPENRYKFLVIFGLKLRPFAGVFHGLFWFSPAPASCVPICPSIRSPYP